MLLKQRMSWAMLLVSVADVSAEALIKLTNITLTSLGPTQLPPLFTPECLFTMLEQETYQVNKITVVLKYCRMRLLPVSEPLQSPLTINSFHNYLPFKALGVANKT